MSFDCNKFLTEVFNCEYCQGVKAFARSPANGRFYKFPPIIGKQHDADVLFIGINPRRTKSNDELHDWLMESPDNFAKLASNKLEGGEPYISPEGEEEHYHCHMIVIENVFGEGTKFEDVAAVTELMHCASPNEPTILSRQKSPCAGLYLQRVMDIVKPRVVIAVGSGVRRQLIKYFGDFVGASPVPMDHPRFLAGKSRDEKLAAMRPTIEAVRKALG